MNTNTGVARPIFRLVVLLALIAASLGIGLSAAPRAHAADLSQFRAGNIISDAVFFDSTALNDAQIQDFLNSKVSRCESGYTCLKSYRQTTSSRGGDAMCSAYQGASNESAASIIGKVARACGISPKVLIVTLQKEQALIVDSSPSTRQYNVAMGYACPDTAPCDTQYYGFYNQVYNAAHQFKRYANPAGTSKFFTWYTPGATATVQWNPNANCGSGRVYIENQATADLYYYTPYQPNAAALRAVYGNGDNCSTYGNRNFFAYFTDWFGSTQTNNDPGAAIRAKYTSEGGANGRYGAPTGSLTYVSGGAYIAYQYGRIYYTTQQRAAYGVRNGLLVAYTENGLDSGALGLPTSDEISISGGALQRFQNNSSIYWNGPLGKGFVTRGGIGDRFESLGGSGGVLGFPKANEVTISAGAYQEFTGGRIYWNKQTGGVAVIRDGLLNTYLSGSAAVRDLGIPVSDEASAVGGGALQRFQDGSLYWNTALATAFVVHGGIGNSYEAQGGSAGSLGLPIANETPSANGVFQAYQNGRIYWRASDGAVMTVTGGNYSVYRDMNLDAGVLGLPLDNERQAAYGRGTYQQFAGGTVYANPTAKRSFAVTGAISQRYESMGGSASKLLLPTSNAENVNGYTVQKFGNGMIAAKGTATFVVWEGLNNAYVAAGGMTGVLGMPTSDEAAGADAVTYQRFTGGSLYWNSKLSQGFALYSAIGDKYEAQGGSAGRLGAPTSNPIPVAGGVMQHFAGGDIYASSAAGAKGFILRDGMRNAFLSAGDVQALGLPTSDEAAQQNGTSVQTFEKGSITWSASGVTVQKK